MTDSGLHKGVFGFVNVALILLSFSDGVLAAVGVNYFESKIIIQPGENSCFYMDLEPSRLFLVDFANHEVDAGVVGRIGFEVYVNETKNLVHLFNSKGHSYEDESLLGGTYKVCLNNDVDHRNHKLVNLYISYYKYEHLNQSFLIESPDLAGFVLDKYIDFENVVDFQLNPEEIMVGFMKQRFEAIEANLKEMVHMSMVSKTFEARDFALSEGIAKYVSYWSTIHCLIIMCSSVFQVYFVRKLFDSDSRGKTKYFFWLNE